MPKLMGMREYARHRGCGLSAVQYAIKAGRIELQVDDDGRKVIDQEAADEAWELNSDQSKRRGKFQKDLEAGDKKKSGAPAEGSFAEAKTQTQMMQAELLKLELLKKQGRSLDAEEVKAEAFRLGRQVRDNMRNIPARTISKIRAAANEHLAFMILEEEINKACEGLPNG